MKAFRVWLTILSVSLATRSLVPAAEDPPISIEDLKAAIAKEEVTLFDVNGSRIYAKGRIPSALDYRAITDLPASLPSDKKALIVAYCGGPSCSAYRAATRKIRRFGYTNVRHLSGGISGWMEAGEPLESD